MKNRGILAVVSGFSGSGKGTIMKELLQQYDNYALSISATTRQPREGEMHGREYFFLSKEEFEQLIKEEKLIEYAQYVGNYYGTPSSFVEEQRDAGKDVILEIEVQGALQVKEKFPDTVLLFVTPPSAEELASRLRGRGTETEEVIAKRMEQAVTESTLIPVAFTVTVAVFLIPLLVVAVMVVVPSLFAVTLPLLTVATFVLLDVHVTVLFVASDGATVAVNVAVSPRSNCADVLSSVIPVGSTGLTTTSHPPER